MQSKSHTNKQRVPTCALCKAHGYAVALKGHKQRCPRQKCKCPKCELVKNKRLIMAAQIRLRREQTKDQSQVQEIKNPFEMSQGNDTVLQAY